LSWLIGIESAETKPATAKISTAQITALIGGTIEFSEQIECRTMMAAIIHLPRFS
jgi:hypothetical protein